MEIYFEGRPLRLAESHKERRLIAFVCRPAKVDVEIVDLGSADDISLAVLDWLRQLAGGKGSAKTESAASRVREMVWEPLESCLDGAELVLISPDGVMNSLPFVALPGDKPGTFLLEKYSFLYVPIPTTIPKILTDRQISLAEAQGLLAIGDVDFGASPSGTTREPRETASILRASHLAPQDRGEFSFATLPGTAQELSSIEKLYHEHFGQRELQMLRGHEATEFAVREGAAASSIIHLATHGWFNSDELPSALATDSKRGASTYKLEIDSRGRMSVTGWHPDLLSGLALAGANRGATVDENGAPTDDDGILTAMEVAALDLSNTDLVVLSACETGLGKQTQGEGLLGLQRAFQVAGAETVVASLWKVDDEATRDLMIRFYENLWVHKMSKVDALRQAQLSVLRGEPRESVDADRGLGPPRQRPGSGNQDRVHPRLWAGWVLSGDPGLKWTRPEKPKGTQATIASATSPTLIPNEPKNSPAKPVLGPRSAFPMYLLAIASMIVLLYIIGSWRLMKWMKS